MQSDFNMKNKTLFNFKPLSLFNRNRLFLMALMLLISFNAQSQTTTLVALGNQSGVPSAMKLSELKSVLMGEKQRWKNGNRILIALMKTNTALGKSTSEKIYDMTGDELNKYWLALVFQGKAQAPVFFSSIVELENYVAQNQGAIGILNKSSLNTEIKNILIDGLKSF